MAGKITIKRVGSIFPALSLVVIVLLFGIIAWLSTIGLPDCALRAIEQEAAKQEITLHLGNIQLAPRSGLAVKAEDVKITLPRQGAAPAVATIRKLQARFRFHELLLGKKTPENIVLMDGEVQLPLSEDANDALKLTKLDAEAIFRKEAPDTMVLKADGLLEEVHVAVLANIPLSRITEKEESEPEQEEIDPEQMLADCRSKLRKVQHIIREQKWDDDTRPSLTVRMDLRTESPRYSVQAEAPQYVFNNICMKDAQLQASFRDHNIVVNNLSFRTENPDTTVMVRGGYDLEERLLDFNANSTAPVFSILQKHFPHPALNDILSRIKIDDKAQPGINLRGSVQFAENYALTHINLRGLFEQNGMRYGESRLDHTLISFYLNDGDINIDKMQLKLPDGHIEASVNVKDGTGHADVHVSLPIVSLKRLAGDIAHREIELPKDFFVNGRLELEVAASMKMAKFQPGITTWEDLIPDPDDLKVDLSVGEIVYQNNVITHPHARLQLDDVDLSLRNPTDLSIAKWQFEAHAAEFRQINDIDVAAAALKLNGGETVCHFAHLQDTAKLALLNAEFSAKHIRVGKTAISQPELKLIDAQNLQHGKSIPQLLAGSKIHLKAATCEQEKVYKISNLTLDTHVESTDNTSLNLSLEAEGKTISSRIALLKEKRAENELLHFSTSQLSLPLAKLGPTLKAVGFETTACKLPEELHLQADGIYNLTDGNLVSTRAQIHIPQLLRTPTTVPVFRGREIPLEIRADITLSPNEAGDICYEGDVWAKHETGVFEGKVDGNAAAFCHVTGNNTILPDVIDSLIDDEDAHSILRDFRFTHGVSTVDVTDIDTTVRYDNGICVASKCNARIRNSEFLLGAILDTKNDGEKLRTDMGSNPYTRVHEATCGVEVDVRWYRKDEHGKPIPDVSFIHLTNPYLHYDNRPWLRKQKISKGVSESKLNGRLITFNLEDCTIALHDIKGRVYPAYSFGMFYSDLQEFMQDVVLSQPADVHSKYCLFPIARRCTVPMTGLIQAEAPRGAAFRFLGTTIPMRNFSGFINISDDDVYLDHMNAATWGGTLNGAVRIGFSGPSTTLDGYIQANNMDLKDIAAAYDTTFNSALCNGNIRFRTKSMDLKDIQAYGTVRIDDGDLLQMRIFRPLGAFISDLGGNLDKLQSMVSSSSSEKSEPGFFSRIFKTIFSSTGKAVDTVTDSVTDNARKIPFANHFIAYDIQRASSDFDIINGWLVTRNMKAHGYNLDVDMQVGLNLDTMEIRGNMWPTISSVPTILLSPITFLSDYMIDLVIFGDVNNIQWKVALDRIIKGRPSVTNKPQGQGDKP